jgi:site-specific DNA recombinase
MKKKRVALYARVSSQAQAEGDKVSLEEQFREMETHCAKRGYEPVARYQDVAPGSTKNRPRFQQMLQDAKDGKFEVVLCWKSDRLSRGIFPAAALMEVVESTGVELEAVADQIDEKTFGIFAAVGKIEIDNFRERSTLGKRGAARRGRWPVGKVPYGYRTVGEGRPEVNPDEARVVREVFERYVHRGQGSKQIADWLTESDAPRRRGSKWGRWFHAQVLTMLSHTAYKGESHYGKRRYRTTQSGSRVTAVPRDEWVSVPFPPIVTAEIWDAAHEVKRSRSALARRNTKAVHLLQGIACCEVCGFRLRVIQQKRSRVKRRGKTYEYTYKAPIRYYKCGGMMEHGLGCRPRSHIKAESFEGLVWDEAVRILKSPKLITNRLLADSTATDAEAMEAAAARAQAEVTKVETEEDRLVRLFVSGKINETQLDHQRKFITERLVQARASLESANGRQKAAEQEAVTGDAVASWAARLGHGIDMLGAAERQMLLRLMLHRVSVNREGRVRITLAIPVEEFMADASGVS